MRRTTWLERLLAGTRGEILRLLRRRDRTVNEIAVELALTDNAIRTHLTALERDGLVQQRQGPSQGLGKPPQIYRALPEADDLLQKAYAPVLGALLGVLNRRLAPEELEAVLQETGRKAAGERAVGDLPARLSAAAAVLDTLGGESEVLPDTAEIRGHSCPLAALIPDHPELCRLIESMVEAVVGAPVRGVCEKGERLRCRFRVGT